MRTTTDGTPEDGRAVRRLVGALAALLAAVVFVLGSSFPALANNGGGEGGGGGGTTAGVCAGTGNGAESLLPVVRWNDSMDLHTRLGWGVSDQFDKAARHGISGLTLDVGNAMWGWATGMVQYAYAFCPINYVGGTMDAAFHDVASAVVDSPLMAILAAVSFAVWMWRLFSASGGGFTQLIWQKMLVMGLFGVMLVGSSMSTGGTGSGSADYQPGTGSPGWFITSIDAVTASVGGGIVSSLSDQDALQVTASADIPAPDYDPGNRYSCEAYAKSLETAYKDSMGTAGAGAAAVPLAVNAYWKLSGLQTWKRVQFGRSNYANIVWCRMLEANRGTPVHLQVGNADVANPARWGTIGGIMNGAGVRLTEETGLFTRPIDNDEKDQFIVAWAACANTSGAKGSTNPTTGWNVPGDREELLRQGDPGAVCDDIAKASADGDWGYDDFNWESGDGEVDDEMNGTGQDTEAARDFVLHLHGKANGGGMVAAATFALSSLLLLVVFGLFALSIMFAKLLGLMMILGVLATLIFSMTPSGDATRVGAYFKQYIGISFYAFGAGLLLAIVTLISNILIKIGVTTLPGGPGGVMTTLWVGVAPFVAAVALHYMFKRLSVPSPMSLKAAGAWGKAAANGNLGSAVAGGVAGGATAGLMSQWGQRGRMKAAQMAKGAAKSRLPGAGNVPDGQGKQQLPPTKETGAPEATTEGAGKRTLVDSDGNPQATIISEGERPKTHKEKVEAQRAADAAKAAEKQSREKFEQSEEGKAKLAGDPLALKHGVGMKAAEATVNAADAMKQRVRDVRDGWRHDLANKPVRTIAKGAAYTVGGVAAGSMGLPVLAGIAGAKLVGKDGFKTAARTATSAARSSLSTAGTAALAAGREYKSDNTTTLGAVAGAAREQVTRDRVWEGKKAAEEAARRRQAEQVAADRQQFDADYRQARIDKAERERRELVESERQAQAGNAPAPQEPGRRRAAPAPAAGSGEPIRRISAKEWAIMPDFARESYVAQGGVPPREPVGPRDGLA